VDRWRRSGCSQKDDFEQEGTFLIKVVQNFTLSGAIHPRYNFLTNGEKQIVDNFIGWNADERRRKNLDICEQAPGIRLVSPSVTLARLMVGPVLLYCALAMVHGGINPIRVSPVFWLGGISVLVGSFLIVIASVPDTHIIWHQIWQKRGDKTPDSQEGLKALGLLLWLLPTLLIIIDGFV
jgi:hypothetical protein